MNRKKKINTILKKRNKKANAKLAPKSKSSYVSKADREKLALENSTTEDTSTTKEPVEQPSEDS